MKTRVNAMLTTLAVMPLCLVASHAAIVVGQSIGIDFANGPNTPGAGVQPNWTVFSGNAGPVGAVDAGDGSAIAGVQITVANFSSASAQMGEPNIGFGGAGIGDYGTYPFSDLSYNDGIYDSPGSSSLTLSGLDDALKYDVLILAGSGYGVNTPVDVTVDGATLNTTYNDYHSGAGGTVLSPALFSSAGTDGSGNLVIQFQSTGWYGINAVYVTAIAPGTPTLSAPTVTNITTTAALGGVELAGMNAHVTLFWGTSNEGQAFTWDATNALTPEHSVGPINGVAIGGLTADTRYYYIFYASNSVSGLAGWSAGDRSFGSALTGLSVSDLSAGAVNATEIELTWTDSFSSETGYVIQRSPDGSAWVALATVGAAASTYTDTGLAEGTTRHYRIAGENGAGLSDWSSAAQTTTPSRPRSIATDFSEATYAEVGLLRDIPDPALASITLDATNDRLVFTTTGNTDMWGARNNAPIGYVLKPTGSLWFMQAEVELATSGTQQLTGFTVYQDMDGARPDFTYAIDYWSGAPGLIKLQGLGDNNPNMNVSAGGATRVILRLEVEDDGGGAGFVRYTLKYDLLSGGGMQTLGTYDSSFSNARVGVFTKTGNNPGRTAYLHALEIDNVGDAGALILFQ